MKDTDTSRAGQEVIWDFDTEVAKFRRAIVQLAVGDSTTVQTPMEFIYAAHQVERFAAKRKLTLATSPVAGGIQIARGEDREPRNKWKVFDELKVGDSILFEHHPRLHGRIKAAAKYKNDQNGWRLTCLREGGYMRVLRLPNDPAAPMVGADGRRIVIATQPTKYELERLELTDRVTIELDELHHNLVRQAASRMARQRGWELVCRKAPDGKSITVHRLDKPSEPAAPIAPAPSPAPVQQAQDEPDDDQPDWPEEEF